MQLKGSKFQACGSQNFIFGVHDHQLYRMDQESNEIKFYRVGAVTLKKRGRGGSLKIHEDHTITLDGRLTPVTWMDSLKDNLYALRFRPVDFTLMTDVFNIDSKTGQVASVASDIDCCSVVEFFAERSYLVADDLTLYRKTPDDSLEEHVCCDSPGCRRYSTSTSGGCARVQPHRTCVDEMSENCEGRGRLPPVRQRQWQASALRTRPSTGTRPRHPTRRGRCRLARHEPRSSARQESGNGST